MIKVIPGMCDGEAVDIIYLLDSDVKVAIEDSYLG